MICYTSGMSPIGYCDAHHRWIDDCGKIFGMDCPQCACFREKLDREKMAKAMFDDPKVSSDGINRLYWDGLTESVKENWRVCADALIAYLTE
jgi:hypothetical protein